MQSPIKSLSLYKNLYKIVNKNSTGTTSFTSAFLEKLRTEFHQNNVSDSKYCVQENQQKFLGHAYLTYLENTDKTIELYSAYSKGERSIKESAAIVGLRLPKVYQPPKE